MPRHSQQRSVILAARQARHGVGHVQANPLLAYDHGADIGARRIFDDVVHGIGDQRLDALAFQDFGNRLRGFHVSLPFAQPTVSVAPDSADFMIASNTSIP